MNRIEKIIATVLTIAALLMISSVAMAVESPYLQQLNFVENIQSVEGDGCGANVVVLNRAGFDDASVARQGNEIHLKLMKTYVHPPVRVFPKLEGKCFSRAAVHQINKQFVKVIFTISPDYQGDMTPTLAVNGNKIGVYIGPAPISALPPTPPVEAPNTPTEVTNQEQASEPPIDLAALLAKEDETKPAEQTEQAATSEPVADEDIAKLAVGENQLNWQGALTKVGFALLLSLGLLFLLVALAKRMRLPSKLNGGKRGLIRVIHTGMLDMKRRIAVVDVAGELIVVALSGNDVTMLTKIESEEARRTLLGEKTNASEPVVEPVPIVATEPAFVTETQTLEAVGGDMPSFGDRLRAYRQQAPSEGDVAERVNLQTIAERVKELKRL